jgi:ABC-type sugar transport system ATPase subunit
VNGDISVRLGEGQVVIPEKTIRRYPGLRRSASKSVVVGVRAANLHPHSERPDFPTITARVELVESLGGETMAYFKLDARQVSSGAVTVDETLVEHEDDAETVVGSRPNLVAAFPPHVQLRLGDDMPVAVDPGALYFFDEETGAPLR